VAAPSSSAAANMVTSFTFNDAEKRVSAPVTRSRALHEVRDEPHRVVFSDAAERSRFPTPRGTVERRPSVASAQFFPELRGCSRFAGTVGHSGLSSEGRVSR
jgi:hypothetical protein